MKEKLFQSIMICLLLTITIFIITYSKDVMSSVSFSISIWKDSLFPSLFPFFVVSNLLLNYGFVDVLGRVFKKIMPKFFSLPGKTSFVFAVSLISGFPSGAKYTTDLVSKGIISKEEAGRLLTFTHYSNPLFILGMIGELLLGDKRLGFLILVCHVVSGIIVGVILSKKRNNTSVLKRKNLELKKKPDSFGVVLKNSIQDSLSTLFLMLGIVTVFLVFTTILKEVFHFNDFIQTIFSGLLEMTQGVQSVSSLPISILEKTIFMTFFISFGGFSVHTQVLSIISSEKIKYKYFFIARLLHAILASILVFITYIFVF